MPSGEGRACGRQHGEACAQEKRPTARVGLDRGLSAHWCAGFPTRVVEHYGWSHSLGIDDAAQVRRSYEGTPKHTPWIIHAAEGTDADAAGELYWGGVAGTQWWISPKHNMAGVMMAQRQMSFVHPFSFEFKRLAYETVKQHAGAMRVPA